MEPNQPYPTHAVPLLLHLAGCCVGSKLKCPDELTVQEMQSLVSTAVQSVIEVEVPTYGRSPTNLWLLTVAESGEGKSAVNGMLSAGLRRFSEEIAERYDAEMLSHQADVESWKAQRDTIRSKIRRMANQGEPTDTLTRIAAEHFKKKPRAPLQHCLRIEEFDRKSLAVTLAAQSKYILIDSHEGALILNRKLVRAAHWLTTLFSGEPFSIRWTDSRLRSFSVTGALATFNLMVQPKPFADLLSQEKDSLVGCGFLPRFLPAYPFSQRGNRLIIDGVKYDESGVEAFSDRIVDILREAPYFKKRVEYKVVMVLSPYARRAWVDTRNAIEAAMAPGARFFAIPEFASRLANNAIRMAANWQFFQYGNAEISAQTLAGATEVCLWHAREFTRMFSDEAQLPEPEKDAILLENWLGKWYWKRSMYWWPLLQLRQYVTRPLRNTVRLRTALQVLVAQGKVVFSKNELGEIIQLNCNYFNNAPGAFPQTPLINGI